MIENPTAATDGVAIPAAEYHSGPGISASQIAAWLETCPAYWRADQDKTTEPSDAMRFGSLVHTMTLEPDEVAVRYAVEPCHIDGEKINRRKPAHREWLANWRASVDDAQELIDGATWARASALAQAVTRDPRWAPLREAQDAVVERSYYWTDAETGLLCKCRPDLFAAGVVVALKTTRDSAAPAFAKQADNLHYGMKAAWYLHGVEQATGQRPDGFVWLTISDRLVPEWYSLDQERLELGAAAWRKALDEIAVCDEADEWPTYSDQAGIVNLPRIAAWRRPKRQEEPDPSPVPEPVEVEREVADEPKPASAPASTVTIQITVNGGEVTL
jgi:hypothetical protein